MKRIFSLVILILAFACTNNQLSHKENQNKYRKIKNGQILLRYNNQGEVVEQIPFGAQNLTVISEDGEEVIIIKTINNFDDNGNIISSLNYDTNNILSYKEFYTTNPEGNILTLEGPDSIFIYNYDSNGLIKSSDFNGEVMEYIYYPDERVKEINGGTFTNKYIYDNSKRVLGYEQYTDNTLTRISHTKYNNEGNIESISYYDVFNNKREFLMRIEYLYD